VIALAMTMAMSKTKKGGGGGGGFHTRRRSGTALNARHREEEDEREYFETYRRRENDNDDSNDNSHEVEDGVGADSVNGSGAASGSGPGSSSGAYLTRLVEVLHEGPSREEEGASVTMQHNESLEDTEGQANGQVHVLVNEETLAVEESDHDVDDVWYDVYDLSALGVPRDDDDGDDIEGGQVSHAQPQVGNYNRHNDDNNEEEGLEEGQGDEDDQWNWGAVGEAGDVFYDSYGDNHDSQASCEDANSSDYYSNRDNDIDDDDDDDDEDDDDDIEGYRCGDRDRDRDRDRDGDSTDAALTRDTALSTNPRILSRSRAFSTYFDRLAKLSDNDKQRDKLKFWAR
jgi:hypothetical protein